jgi:hypothetical protein
VQSIEKNLPPDPKQVRAFLTSFRFDYIERYQVILSDREQNHLRHLRIKFDDDGKLSQKDFMQLDEYAFERPEKGAKR